MASTSNLPLTRVRRVKKTRTKEVLGAEVVERVIVATTPLQWELMPMPSRKTRETFPKLSASPVIGRDITRTVISKIRRGSLKTSVSLGNFHAGDWD